jgi:hypothetical protein
MKMVKIIFFFLRLLSSIRFLFVADFLLIPDLLLEIQIVAEPVLLNCFLCFLNYFCCQNNFLDFQFAVPEQFGLNLLCFLSRFSNCFRLNFCQLELAAYFLFLPDSSRLLNWFCRKCHDSSYNFYPCRFYLWQFYLY